MKTIICGGRDYMFTQADFAELDELRAKIPITEVVSGTANGADMCGEIWATRSGLVVTRFEPSWSKYGKAAGFMRNADMASYAEACVAFPGGRGTDDMVRRALASKLVVTWAGKKK